MCNILFLPYIGLVFIQSMQTGNLFASIVKQLDVYVTLVIYQ